MRIENTSPELLTIETPFDRPILSFEERSDWVYVWIGNEHIGIPKREWRKVATAIFNFARD